MKKRGKRVAAMALCSLILASIGTSTMSAYAAEATNREEQSYVVVAESPEVCSRLSQRYGDNETPVSVQDDGILFLSLTEQEKKQLEKQENVQVEEDLIVTASGETADDDDVLSIPPEEQWNLNMVSAILAEDTGISNKELSKIKVAVLDSGVSFTSDINVERFVNFVPGEEEIFPLYQDITGHGTSVASVIAAMNNEIGTTGVNPNATLYSVRVLDDNNEAPVSRVIEGIYWCIDNDVNIINMSFGMDTYNEALHAAIQAANDAGILLIASSGNENQIQYPAAFPEVMAVGSVNTKGEVTHSDEIANEIELFAPGEKIPATGFLDTIIETQGTSMAAPHVTATASVLWAKNPNASAQFIRNLLDQSARDTASAHVVGGVVDLSYALECYDIAEDIALKTKQDEFAIPKNIEKVEDFSDTNVTAAWGTGDHVKAIEDYPKTGSRTDWNFPSNMIEYVKYGIKAADAYQYLHDAETADCFHGYSNYVSNTVYLAQIAKETERVGMTTAIENIPYPVADPKFMLVNNGNNGNQKSSKQISTILKGLNTTARWDAALAPFGKTIADISNSKPKKAYFILGLSTHTAMDSFAHRTYGYYNGEWVHVKDISASKSGDSRDDFPNRWEVAVKVAYTVLDRYYRGNTMDASIYYKPKYYTPVDFKLYAFSTYYNYCSTTSYQENKDWIDERTYTK